MKSLWVAIPDSVVSEQKGAREKTEKLGYIARACAIFGVEKIFVYSDPDRYHRKDRELIVNVLRYVETPPYLRKKLFSITRELSYAGVLPPLRIPSHKEKVEAKNLMKGEIREAVLEDVKGRLFADIGLDVLVPFEGKGRHGERLAVRIEGGYPNLRCVRVEKDEIKEYWGYEVKSVGALEKLIASVKADYVILTSRYGKAIHRIWEEFVGKISLSDRVLVVFGSPKKGLLEMLSKGWIEKHNLPVINTMPGQRVETIRTEEALLATLAILNVANKLG